MHKNKNERRLRVSPTLNEKRYYTLQFLEASEMHGNLVRIHQVDKYEISALSSETFTHKPPVETYIIFDERPKVNLLRKYGWFREDQEIQPIIAYIPTHLIYSKEKLTKHREYKLSTEVPELFKEDKLIYKVSDNLKYVAYKTNDRIEVYKIIDNKPEANALVSLNNDQDDIRDVFFDEMNETILITKQDTENALNELIELNKESYNLPLHDLEREQIENVIYNKDKVLIKTDKKQSIYEIKNVYKHYLDIPSEIGDILEYKKSTIINEHYVVYEILNKIPRKYTLEIENDINIINATLDIKQDIVAIMTDVEELRLYKLNRRTRSLEYLYAIHTQTTIAPKVKLKNNLITLIDNLDNVTNIQVYSYNKDRYKQRANLFRNKINVKQIIKFNEAIYLTEDGGAIKVKPEGEDNYDEAIVNRSRSADYRYLDGDDIKPLIEQGESKDYLLEELLIKRGALIDIYYDYGPRGKSWDSVDKVARSENLFYVTDVKIDTISINYVAHLMPYKYDKEPEGEVDSNTPLFKINTRDEQL